MINAIIQIPNRFPIGTVMFGGCVDEKVLAGRSVKLLSGRSIRIVPLIFYKFFSQWGDSCYEHIFATDEPFDPISMSRFMDSTTGDYSKALAGSMLVPISMKRIGKHSVETFLFAKSINYLLSTYQIGTPLSSVPFCGPESFDMNKGLEVVDESGLFSGGVVSYGDFRKNMFEDVLYSTYGTNKLPSHLEFALSHMTSERPSTIDSCMEELTYNYSSVDAVWNYIDELYRYETGEPIDPSEFFTEHNYRESIIDPLTLKCLRTPTFIMSSNIKPYVSPISMRRYGIMGLDPQTDDFTKNIIPFQFGNLCAHSKNELMESLMSIPDDGFTIRMTWDNYIPEFYSIFGHDVSLPAEQIHNACRQLFLNKWVNGEYAYDDIVVSKNWFDEIFISCKNKIGITTYYINLAWYHLMSPSLINMTSMINR